MTAISLLYVLHTGPLIQVPAPLAAINKAEYFFDTDPGFSSATSLAITPGNDAGNSGLTDVSSLPVGTHRYYARAKDQKGNWSLSQERRFSIVAVMVALPSHPAQAVFSALEYFVDTDPGFGNGTIVPVHTLMFSPIP